MVNGAILLNSEPDSGPHGSDVRSGDVGETVRIQKYSSGPL